MKHLMILLVTLMTQQVWATGETFCSMNVGNAKVDMYLLNSRLPGAPVLDGEATVTIDNKINQHFKVKNHDLVGWWDLDGELKAFFLIPASGKDIRDSQLKITTTWSDVHGIHLGTVHYIGPQGEEFTEIIHCELG